AGTRMSVVPGATATGASSGVSTTGAPSGSHGGRTAPWTDGPTTTPRPNDAPVTRRQKIGLTVAPFPTHTTSATALPATVTRAARRSWPPVDPTEPACTCTC